MLGADVGVVVGAVDGNVVGRDEGGLDGDALLVINSYSSLSMSRMSHSLTLLTTTVPMTPL